MIKLPKYRMVHYIVIPWADLRVPVAAVVMNEGVVSTVTRPLSAERVGSIVAHTHIAACEPILSRNTSFDDLPGFLGPHFILGPPQDIPTQSWEEWIQITVFRVGVPA